MYTSRAQMELLLMGLCSDYLFGQIGRIFSAKRIPKFMSCFCNMASLSCTFVKTNYTHLTLLKNHLLIKV